MIPDLINKAESLNLLQRPNQAINWPAKLWGAAEVEQGQARTSSLKAEDLSHQRPQIQTTLPEAD